MSITGRRDQRAFQTGKPYTAQREDITPDKKGPFNTYSDLVSPGAEKLQDALLRLIGSDGPAYPSMRNTAKNFAASDEMLQIIKALPAVAAVGGVGSAIGSTADLVTGEESGNRAMDLLGMGAGAYGMHRGQVGGTTPAGRALSIMAGLAAGKLGSDATQGVVGGMF